MLCEQYDLLKGIKEDEIPSSGYSYAKVSYALIIDNQGTLKGILDLRQEDHKKKLRPVSWQVPEQPKRAGKNPPAYFLCDNAKYVLGYNRTTKKDKVTEEITEDRFKLFCDCHKAVLNTNHPIINFLENWQPDNAANHPIISSRIDSLDFTGNFVFYHEETGEYFHQDDCLIQHYLKVTQNSRDEPVEMNCLVTGRPDKIARIHTAIKGVRGAQAAGANIIGFNDSAFCSYGKSQSYNAPVGEIAMFKYTTALNYMLANQSYNYALNEQTIVFWANSQDKASELVKSGLFGNHKSVDAKTEEKPLIDQTKDLLKKAKYGLKAACQTYGINPEQNLYILGLSPNNARLSVSLWHVNSLAYFVERLRIHHDDLNIAGNDEIIPIWKITNETIPRKSKDKKVSPLIEKSLLESILVKDKSYPIALYQAILNRIKAEQYINVTRAAIIKAYRTRKDRMTKKGVGLPVALDKDNQNVAYQVGRLFALLEKIQKEAISGIKNTIKESYFSSALASPAAVFPRLLKLSNFHTAKLDHRISLEKQKADIINNIASFPKRLSLDEQGDFVVGYYHQNRYMYLTKEEREKENN